MRKAMVAFGMAAAIGLFVATYFVVLGCPYPITYEGIELLASWQLAHGENIYALERLSSEPWIVNIYPPLMAAIGQFFAARPAELLLGLRFISVASFGATLFCLFMLARRMGAGIASTCGALVLFTTCVPVWFTSFIAKPDYLCMALQGAAWLSFFMRFETDDPKATYKAAAIFSLFAMLAKQQGILAPISIVVFLLLQKRFISALKFAALVAGLLAAAMILLQLLTGGFVQHLFFLHQVPWNIININYNFQSLGYDAVKIALLCIFALMYRPSDVRERVCYNFAVTVFFVCLPELAYIFGIPGATSNHFITPLFALSLLAALMGTRFVWLAPLLSVVSVVLVIDMFEFAKSQCDKATVAALNMSAKLPRDTSLLSEDPYWVLYTGDKPVIGDPTTIVNAWRRHTEGDLPMIERIKNKAYGGILINEFDDRMGGGDIWTREIVSAVKDNYVPVAQGTGNGKVQILYVPK